MSGYRAVMPTDDGWEQPTTKTSRIDQQDTHENYPSDGSSSIEKQEGVSSIDSTEQHVNWEPSLFQPEAFSGLLALGIAAAAMVASLLILLFSDGQPTKSWTVQPTVYLAIASAVAAAALRFAKGRAMPIAWWHDMLYGSSIRKLEYKWEAGQSVSKAVIRIGAAPGVSIATIIVVLMVIDAALLQRASTVVSATLTNEIDVSLMVSPEVPYGFVGSVDHGGLLPSYGFDTSWADYLADTPMSVNASGCGTGTTCTTSVQGPGVVMQNCTTNTVQITKAMMTDPHADWSGQVKNEPAKDGYPHEYAQPIFEVYMTSHFANNNHSTLQETGVLETRIANWTPDGGHFQIQNCQLVPTILDYDVEVQQGEDDATIGLLSPQGRPVARVNNTQMPPVYYDGQFPLTILGFYFYLQALTNAHVTASLPDPAPPGQYWAPGDSTQNTFSAHFMVTSRSEIAWRDPRDDVVEKVNSFMFRAAVMTATWDNTTARLDPGLSPKQNTVAVQTLTENVFHTDLRWFAGAAVLDILAILAVLPLFWGWWRLPRSLTFSPFELGLAFDAPLLKDIHSTAGAEGVVKKIGKKEVALGSVIGHARNNGRSIWRLGIGHASHVSPPSRRTTFIK